MLKYYYGFLYFIDTMLLFHMKFRIKKMLLNASKWHRFIAPYPLVLFWAPWSTQPDISVLQTILMNLENIPGENLMYVL